MLISLVLIGSCLYFPVQSSKTFSFCIVMTFGGMKINYCLYSQQLEEDIIDLKASKEVVKEELNKVCILKSQFHF